MPIASYVPLMMFAVLFGLSMDYEVFLVSHVQTHHHQGEAAKEAVAAGLGSSARITSAAALIMASVFASFILNGDPVIKQFGVGLATAVVLAGILVVTLAPAPIVLFGEAAWWLPGWLDKLLPHISVEGETMPSTEPTTARTRTRRRPGGPGSAGAGRDPRRPEGSSGGLGRWPAAVRSVARRRRRRRGIVAAIATPTKAATAPTTKQAWNAPLVGQLEAHRSDVVELVRIVAITAADERGAHRPHQRVDADGGRRLACGRGVEDQGRHRGVPDADSGGGDARADQQLPGRAHQRHGATT